MAEYNVQIKKYVKSSDSYDDLNPVTKLNNIKELIEDVNNPGCYYRMVGSEKEWFNPPMVEGEEYRTVKKFLGKPVYRVALGVTGITETMTFNTRPYNIKLYAEAPLATSPDFTLSAFNGKSFTDAYTSYFLAISPFVVTLRIGKGQTNPNKKMQLSLAYIKK